MATFSFQPSASPADSQLQSRDNLGLGGDLLFVDARWFTRIRWFVALTLVGLGMLGRVLPESVTAELGIVLPRVWPFAVAAALALLNLISLKWLRKIRPDHEVRTIVANIWFQIGSDLVVLSALTTLMGPTGTLMGFAFLFHIVVA